MKSSFKAFKVFITGICVCVFILSFLLSSGNNIRIHGTVQVTQGAGDTLELSFPLRWDNSWRDQFNWDAAWVFFKYKSGTGGWNHVNLCAGGHRFTDGSGLPVPFDCMAGNTGSSTIGLFVYQSTLDVGNTLEIVCQIKCLKSSLGGLTVEQFQKHEGFVLAQAVEMVYVPYGGYYLGDGGCSNRFAGGSDGSPVPIDSEDAITASTATKVYPVINGVTGTAQSIAAVYPKGYKGFYMMKYEVSQEQWVYFLNTLTYTQQQERVPGLSTLKSGEYIFGSKSTPSNRNGIIVNVESNGSVPVIFANNLNNNDVYSEDGDGKTIACNYLSPGDMLAYCSWAGLRPMSELEYEKACRSSYPEQPIKGEYAWHDNGIAGRLNAVSNSGLRNERSGTANANVNAGNGFGPVRCGLFATGSSTQQSAGVAFWGGMELSGNVKEMCYNIAYTGFNGSTMGTGTYNTALWSATPAHFGVKGGGFSSVDSLLRVSDRTEAGNYFTTVERRDSTVGFRGVRTIGSEVTITQGRLIASQNGVTVTGTACPDVQLDLKTDVEAKVMSGSNEVANMDISYVWYVLKPGATEDSIVPGATGAMLSYNDLKVTGTAASVTCKFKRKAICPVGEAMTDYITFTIPNMNLTLNLTEVSIDACDNSTLVTIKVYCSTPVYTWKYGDKVLKTGSTYLPSRNDFDGAGDFTVDVTVGSGSCMSEKQFLKIRITDVQEVASTAVTLSNCGDVLAIDSRDNQRYCTVKVGVQCWMGRNLSTNVGGGACIAGDCDKYGRWYTWSTAMNGGSVSSANPSGVRGVCPEGWHIPSLSEFTLMVSCAAFNCGALPVSSTDYARIFAVDCNVPGFSAWAPSGVPVNVAGTSGLNFRWAAAAGDHRNYVLTNVVGAQMDQSAFSGSTTNWQNSSTWSNYRSYNVGYNYNQVRCLRD